MKRVQISSTKTYVFKYSIYFFSFLILLKYILFYTFKRLFTKHIEVYVDVTSNDGRLEQSNCQ